MYSSFELANLHWLANRIIQNNIQEACYIVCIKVSVLFKIFCITQPFTLLQNKDVTNIYSVLMIER